MVPLPMTAAEKFNEAAYFFNQMIATVNNTRIFPFNLSAFLSALRSTTFYLQVQYGHEQRFADWYGRAQEKMKNDPVLKMLTELRRQAVHLKPVNLLVNSGPRFHQNPIETDHLELMHTTDDEGNIIWRYKVDRDGQERQADPITDWVFEHNEQPVLVACRHGLEQLDSLLKEWNALFGTGVAMEGEESRQP